MKKILVVSAKADKNIIGGALRIFRQTNYLSENSDYLIHFLSYEKINYSDKIKYIKNYSYNSSFIRLIILFPINIIKNFLILKKNKYDIIQFWGFGIINVSINIPFKLLKNKASIRLLGTTSTVQETPSSLVKKRFGELILKSVKKHDGIICISKSIYSEWENYKYYGKLFYIPNSVNHEHFNVIDSKNKFKLRKELGFDEFHFIINNTALVKSRKGSLFILEALRELKNQYQQNFLFLSLGRIDDVEYYESLIKFVKDNDLSSNVLFLGEVKNIKKYYQISDLFLFASEQEGFPNACLEALSTGLPIIMREIKGLSKSIVNNNGFIIKDSKEMAKKIDYYQNNLNLIGIHGNNSRSLIEKTYTEKKINDLYIKAYDEVLRER